VRVWVVRLDAVLCCAVLCRCVQGRPGVGAVGWLVGAVRVRVFVRQSRHGNVPWTVQGGQCVGAMPMCPGQWLGRPGRG
jgi:hypothetical protein